LGFLADLGEGPIAADTVVFIYLIEEHPRFLPLLAPLFEEADRGLRKIVTSALTLLEVLVVPYRHRNRKLAEQYEAILARSRGIDLVDVTREQLKAAAQIRAAAGVKTPDALQLAAAVTSGCKVLVTNDRRLPDIAKTRVIQLGAYLNASGGVERRRENKL
jgi:predicted nucleic acid-binding protein